MCHDLIFAVKFHVAKKRFCWVTKILITTMIGYSSHRHHLSRVTFITFHFFCHKCLLRYFTRLVSLINDIDLNQSWLIYCWIHGYYKHCVSIMTLGGNIFSFKIRLNRFQILKVKFQVVKKIFVWENQKQKIKLIVCN